MFPDNIFYFSTFKTNCKLTFTTQNIAVDKAKDVSSEPFTRGESLESGSFRFNGSFHSLTSIHLLSVSGVNSTM